MARRQVELQVKNCHAVGLNFTHQGLHDPHIWHQKRQVGQQEGPQDFFCYLWCPGVEAVEEVVSK